MKTQDSQNLKKERKKERKGCTILCCNDNQLSISILKQTYFLLTLPAPPALVATWEVGDVFCQLQFIRRMLAVELDKILEVSGVPGSILF